MMIRKRAIFNLFVFLILGVFQGSLQALKFPNYYVAPASEARVINGSDSILFDLSNATITASYVDINVFIKSDDIIFAVDYAFKFNLSKLTYSSSVSMVQGNPGLMWTSYYNSTDLYLRYTGSSSLPLPNTGSSPFVKIRFALSAACIPLSNSDFTNGLTILNGIQCPHRFTTINFLNYIPTARFGVLSPCSNSITIFKDSSMVSRGSIASWQWSISSGINTGSRDFFTTFTTTGTYSANLVVTAVSGCKDTLNKQFTVYQSPTASFTYTYLCSKDTVLFTNTSTSPNAGIQTSSWYFGDLSPLNNLLNPAHYFPTPGFYKVKLTVGDGTGCFNSVQNTISLQPTDFNKDGVVDINDFLYFAPFYGYGCF